jgi:hypothetical protein
VFCRFLKLASCLCYVLLEITALHVLENYVELAYLVSLLRDEIKILNNVWMLEALGYLEFLVH